MNFVYQKEIDIDGIFYEDPKTMATLLAYYKGHYIYYVSVIITFWQSNFIQQYIKVIVID